MPDCLTAPPQCVYSDRLSSRFSSSCSPTCPPSVSQEEALLLAAPSTDMAGRLAPVPEHGHLPAGPSSPGQQEVPKTRPASRWFDRRVCPYLSLVSTLLCQPPRPSSPSSSAVVAGGGGGYGGVSPLFIDLKRRKNVVIGQSSTGPSSLTGWASMTHEASKPEGGPASRTALALTPAHGPCPRPFPCAMTAVPSLSPGSGDKASVRVGLPAEVESVAVRGLLGGRSYRRRRACAIDPQHLILSSTW